MVGKQMIYSPERNTQWLHNEHYKSLLLCYPIIDVIIISLCWPLILFHHVRNGFSLTCPHVFPISAGFQLTLFLEVGRAVPLAPLYLQTTSRKIWIQAIASSFVGHMHKPSSYCIQSPTHYYWGPGSSNYFYKTASVNTCHLPKKRRLVGVYFGRLRTLQAN